MGVTESIATKSIGYYICWLWLVGKGKIQSLVEQEGDEEDEESNTFLTSLRSENILPLLMVLDLPHHLPKHYPS